jgi:hypothetical protein
MILTIQFCSDERLMIPGTDAVAAYGHAMKIGKGELGEFFPYRSPRDQVQHYGRQHYILRSVEDEDGDPIDHQDIDVVLSGTSDPLPGQESPEPRGIHDVNRTAEMRTFGADIGDVHQVTKEMGDDDAEREEVSEEEEVKPKRTRKRTASKKSASSSGRTRSRK